MSEFVKNHLRRLLKRSESVTGTDNIYVAKQGFWATFPFIISTLLSGGLVIAFANLLPKETYGTYRYILSAGGIISFLTLTGMNTALTQAIAQGAKGLLAWSIRIQLRFNSLYTLACLIGAIYYWFHDNHTLAAGIAIMGITFPLNTALTSYGAYLAGKKDFKTGAHYAVISSIFFSAIVLTTLLLTNNVLLLVSAYAIGILAPSIFFYFRTVREDIQYAPQPLEQKDVLRYGTHLSIVPVISVIAQYLDKIILFQVVGAVELAIYALAQAMPERSKGLAKSASSIFLPKLSERSLSEIRPIFYQRIFMGAVVGMLFFVAYWITAPFIFKLLLPGYLESVTYSRILMANIILAVPFNYVGAAFRSQKMLRAIYLSSFVARTPTIILYLVLGLTWGVLGMVWANIVGFALTFLGTLIIWEIESRRLSAI